MNKLLAAAVLATVVVTSCGDTPKAAQPATITLIAYDSFPTKDSDLNAALSEFTAKTGVKVNLVIGGDAGTMVTKARLTAGQPEGDVLFGIDNTLLSGAVADKVFAPYSSTNLHELDPALVALAPAHEVTPVDYGDVCINYDKRWFTEHQLPPPASFEQLADPAYKDLLVVEDPSQSSPGLVFLMATIAHFGDDGWQPYWKALRANGVKVSGDWTTAYFSEFSGAAGSPGTRPLVVSYASSPPAEVVLADPQPSEAPTSAIASTCFRQVEFTGVLRGTRHEAEARMLVDFLTSERFQAAMPLTLFVYPAHTGVPLPDAFVKYTVVPAAPLSLDPASIAAHRQEWQDEWNTIVVR